MKSLNTRKNRIIIISTLIAAVIYLVTGYILYTKTEPTLYKILNENPVASAPIGEITEGRTVEQVIPVQDHTEQVSLKFATFARTNHGNVDISITGTNSGFEYYHELSDVERFSDNEFIYFTLTAPVDAQEDPALTISVTADSLPNEGLTLWMDPLNTLERSSLTINGEPIPGTLTFRTGIMNVPFFTVSRFAELFYFTAIIFLLACMIGYNAQYHLIPGELFYTKAPHTSVSAGKSTQIAIVLFFLIPVIYGIFLYMNWSADSHAYTFSRWQFHLLFILFSLVFWKSSEKNIKLSYHFIILIGLSLLLLDKEFNVIDESGHFEIIRYVSEFHRMPLIYDNYEAVQGPIYYYLMAILTGWMPASLGFIVCRLLGLAALILFAKIGRNLIYKLEQHHYIDADPALRDSVWLLFMANPAILIRLTRVSNESLALILCSIIIYLVICQILDGFSGKQLLLITCLCAVAFLTKATTVFVFGGVILICIYYKQWKTLVAHICIFTLWATPWFASNYSIYGALTAMEEHIDYVLPIVNPTGAPVDLFDSFFNIFDNYFYSAEESGYWYIYPQISWFISFTFMFLLITGIGIALKYVAEFITKKLLFTYSSHEHRKILIILFAALPAAAICMHAVSSYTTGIRSMDCNRYYYMLNNVFAAFFLIAASHSSKTEQKWYAGVITVCHCYMLTSLIIGYTGLILPQYFPL